MAADATTLVLVDDHEMVLHGLAAMLSHFAVGAARSVFTGRGVLRSGMDMFAVGVGVAAVGYVVGDVIARLL